MRLLLGSVILLLIIQTGIGASYDTLYIVKGQRTYGSSTMNQLGFSSSSLFENAPALIHGQLGDTLYLSIYNFDSNYHRVQFSSFTQNTDSIEPGGVFQYTLPLTGEGIYEFHDDLGDGISKYMGLYGVLEIGLKHPTFYWQLSETDTNWTTANWDMNNTYQPQYFSINHRNAPETMTDSIGAVTGSVGDTILIAIANHGMMKHAIHFHGYHCTIIFDSKDQGRLGWIKETFPVDIGAQMILRLIPDQPGDYPVHDHNLMAVLGAGEYIKGMMTMIKIIE